MIVRVFSARLKPGKRPAFERLCREKSIPTMRAVPGCLTCHIGDARPDRPDDLVFVSLWADLASLRAFAGARWQEASILPGEADLLEEVAVRHFDESYRSLVEMWHAVADTVRRREARATAARLSDAQWERIRPLLPAAPSGRGRGRPRADDRAALDGILYVLRNGCRWGDLPAEYPSPATCWRRFTRWERDGTWERIWRALLTTLDAPARQAWALAFLDSRNVPTKRGRGPRPGVAAPPRDAAEQHSGVPADPTARAARAVTSPV